jgi:hypothetical protein
MLPLSGQISLSDVNVEIGNPATAQITMNDTNVRKVMARTTNASEIGMNAAYNKSFAQLYTMDCTRIGAGNVPPWGTSYTIDPITFQISQLADTGFRPGGYSGTDSFTGPSDFACSNDTMCILTYVLPISGNFYPVVFTSKNRGVSWSRIVLSNLGYPYVSTLPITYAGNKFFIPISRSDYTNYLYYSSDGINWSYTSLPAQASKQNNKSVTYDGTYYRIWGAAAALGVPIVSLVSTNGINWSTGPSFTLGIGNGDSNYGSQFLNIRYGGGVYIASCVAIGNFTGYNGANYSNSNYRFHMRSTDATNWSLVPGSGILNGYGYYYIKAWQDAEYVGNNTWLAACTDAYYYTPPSNPNAVPRRCPYLRSTDGGQTWTGYNPPTSNSTLNNTVPAGSSYWAGKYFTTRNAPDGIVFGCWSDGSVWKSKDYGATWSLAYNATDGSTYQRYPTLLF